MATPHQQQHSVIDLAQTLHTTALDYLHATPTLPYKMHERGHASWKLIWPTLPRGVSAIPRPSVEVIPYFSLEPEQART
jgi:hypothetical protein